MLYIHSLDFALFIYVTKIRQFHVSQFWHGTGPISPFVVLALSFVYCCYMARILQIMHKKYSNNHLSCSIILDLGFFSVWWIQILRRSAQMPRTSLKIISMSPAIKAADTFQRHTPETGGKILWSFPLPGPYSK